MSKRMVLQIIGFGIALGGIGGHIFETLLYNVLAISIGLFIIWIYR